MWWQDPGWPSTGSLFFIKPPSTKIYNVMPLEFIRPGRFLEIFEEAKWQHPGKSGSRRAGWQHTYDTGPLLPLPPIVPKGGGSRYCGHSERMTWRFFCVWFSFTYKITAYRNFISLLHLAQKLTRQCAQGYMTYDIGTFHRKNKFTFVLSYRDLI